MHKIQVEELQDIEAPESSHVGWPTVARKRDGELLIVYSGGRHQHVCPFGQVHLLTSNDDGQSWSQPRVLVDGPLDDRDAGALETRDGTLIVNWFTSRLWEVRMQNPSDPWHNLLEAEKAEWRGRQQSLTDEIRQSEMGAWCIRSGDGGQSWSDKIATLVNSPHGPCELSDGRLLYVGRKVGATEDRGTAFEATVGVATSDDDGQSWQMLAEIAPLAGHDSLEYHELHAVEAADGSIIAQLRNHNEPHKYEILQTESHDGGASWTTPHPTGLWGYPPFLLRASDGRLITTFSQRREPFSNSIAISDDNGQSWGEALPINTDSSGDMGYPSTVELAPNRFLSAWYDTKGREQTYLRTARWSLV